MRHLLIIGIGAKKLKEEKHRSNFRKSKLKNTKTYDPNKTEFQIMEEEGYNWIYDCGNLKFVLKKE